MEPSINISKYVVPVAAVTGVVLYKQSHGNSLAEHFADMYSSDKLFTHQFIIYAAVVFASFVLGLKHKEFRPGISVWWWL